MSPCISSSHVEPLLSELVGEDIDGAAVGELAGELLGEVALELLGPWILSLDLVHTWQDVPQSVRVNATMFHFKPCLGGPHSP